MKISVLYCVVKYGKDYKKAFIELKAKRMGFKIMQPIKPEVIDENKAST